MMVRTPRPAARVLLIDEAGHVMLFRFTPPDRAPFWCTPGGALDPGESYEQAAQRELLEETGIDADPGSQVLRRVVDFVTIQGVPVTADERYFLVRVVQPRIDTSRHTPLEQQVMREWHWFDAADLLAVDEPVFPEDLSDIISRLM